MFVIDSKGIEFFKLRDKCAEYTYSQTCSIQLLLAIRKCKIESWGTHHLNDLILGFKA